ncbi:FAD-binding domain-containing protein [Pavlovales sp. CCMP2436]|nr:FAD-binding domain-containing protein [Pavlovales sp. CCMP2436]
MTGTRPWRPYEDTPPQFRRPLAVRWLASYPLQRPAFTVRGSHFTVGELLVIAAATAYFVWGVWANHWRTGGVWTSGQHARLPLLVAFLTASRSSIFSFAIGLPFERALYWHKLSAVWGVLLGAWHGYIAYSELHAAPEARPKMRTGWAVQAGYTALCVAAVPPLRRRFFETYYRGHVFLALYSAAATHSHGGSVVLVGFGLWVVDVVLRLGLRAAFWNPRTAHLTRLPSKVVRISFPKGDPPYRAGSYVPPRVPKLGLLEWHPFSISTAPFQPEVQLHARVLGDWTERLHALAGEQPEVCEVLLDGPYGGPSVDLEGDRYKIFLLLSGGIGVTPMQSVCNSLIDQGARGRPLHMVWTAWMCADKHLLGSMVANEDAPSKLRRTSNLPAVFGPLLLTQLGSSTAIGERYELHAIGEHSIDLRSSTDKPTSKPTLFSLELEELAELSARAEGERRVAVLTCGPAKLVASVRAACDAHSGDGVAFDLHSEMFEF